MAILLCKLLLLMAAPTACRGLHAGQLQDHIFFISSARVFNFSIALMYYF
jgi:hypothetical protein